MTDYQKQASDFLEITGTEFKAEFLESTKHFSDDTDVRDVYKIVLKRGQREYAFKFGQSLAKSQYYQDKRHLDRKYTLSGGCLSGNYKILDINKYQGGGNDLKLIKGEPPTPYDVLAALTKYPVYDFADFCFEYGYDNDSRKAFKIYKSVKREWENIAILYTDSELEILREIN